MSVNHPSNDNGRSTTRLNYLGGRLSCAISTKALKSLDDLVGSRQPGDLEILSTLVGVGGVIGRGATYLLVAFANSGDAGVVPAMRALAASSNQRQIRGARKVLALLGDRASQLWLMGGRELAATRFCAEITAAAAPTPGVVSLPVHTSANDVQAPKGVA